MFNQYFSLGYEHILNIEALDHILFILVLCALYDLHHWKKLLYLVTAFTIGHSITLVMTALDIIRVSSAIVEFLIPVTIFLTAVYNLIVLGLKREQKKAVRYQYMLGLFFGFIHGMAFSSILKASLFPGEEGKLVIQLLAFNLGVEGGQIVLVILFLMASYLVLDIGRLKKIVWKLSLTIVPLIYSFYLAAQNWPY
jgi:signal transduction histidine kinase